MGVIERNNCVGNNLRMTLDIKSNFITIYIRISFTFYIYLVNNLQFIDYQEQKQWRNVISVISSNNNLSKRSLINHHYLFRSINNKLSKIFI